MPRYSIGMGRRRKGRQRRSSHSILKSDKLFVWVTGVLAVGTTLYMYWDSIAPYLAFMVAFVTLCVVVYGAHRFYRRHKKSIHREWAGVRRSIRAKKAQLRRQDTFEYDVAQLFRKQGYRATMTETPGMQGVDIELEKEGRRYAVRTDTTPLNEEVAERTVRGFVDRIGVYGYDGAYYVTKGRFSPGAVLWASRNERLVLIDGAGVLEMRERTENHT